MENVWKDSGVSIPVGRWAQEPCWRCHRQPEVGEVVQLDMMAQTVLCARCVNEDTTRLINALAKGSNVRYPELNDGSGA